MVRGEKPIELGDSWFSAKFIEVKRHGAIAGEVEHSLEAMRLLWKLRIPQIPLEWNDKPVADRLRMLRS